MRPKTGTNTLFRMDKPDQDQLTCTSGCRRSGLVHTGNACKRSGGRGAGGGRGGGGQVPSVEDE